MPHPWGGVHPITRPGLGASCRGPPGWRTSWQSAHRHRALAELGHWLINKRGPEVVRCGCEPSLSPALGVQREIGASGQRPTIPEGNGPPAADGQGLVRRRYAVTPHSVPPINSARKCRVPSGLVQCAGHPEPCPAATGGSGFTIEIGSDFVIGPTWGKTEPEQTTAGA